MESKENNDQIGTPSIFDFAIQNCWVIRRKYKLVCFSRHYLNVRYGYNVKHGSKLYCCDLSLRLEWGCVKAININHLYGLPSINMEKHMSHE